MMPKENIYKIEEIVKDLNTPALILSTFVGRGMHTLGEAVRECFPESAKVYHHPIEEFLPKRAVDEDLRRYKIISNKFRFLLYLIYKLPFFYYRKYLREKFFSKNDLGVLKNKIEELNIKTVICISHRAAFWVSSLKQKSKMRFDIWDIVGEYGKNLGYKYIFWEEINGFLSPVDKAAMNIDFPEHVKFYKIYLPARRDFYKIASIKGDHDKVLLVCGFWGQGPIREILRMLLKEIPQLNVYAICGENNKLYDNVMLLFKGATNVKVYGIVDNLCPYLKDCACIITKPGISTILEAHAAQRKIFLLKGMPIAEDNNARFAIEHFGAEWFNLENFKRWHAGIGHNK